VADERPALRPEQAAIDRRWMSVALGLGRRGLGATAPNPPVGAVLIAPDPTGGRVLGRGWTGRGGRPHAERIALERAGAAARGATLYVTLEPCSHHGVTPPCADAVIEAGVARVVAAAMDPDPRVSGRGVARLRAAGLAVTLGVGRAEAARLNAGHIARVTLGRPHVALKLAVSRDGKVAAAGRKPVPISGEASRARVHLMRAEADAILVGVGTVLADDPALTCRLPGMAARSPIRVVLDSQLRTPPAARLVATARETPTWIIGTEDAPVDRERALRAAGVEVMRVAAVGGRCALPETLQLLALRGVTRLMVEGGPAVASALLAADLIDEATIVTGPGTLGPDAVDAFPMGIAPDASPSFLQRSERQVEADVWRTYERCAGAADEYLGRALGGTS